MKPRLIGISGPLAGSVVDLTENETSLGRDDFNAVAVDDELVSRRHCLIVRNEAGEFSVRDLNSYNQTFVNGLPVREHSLQDGDQLQVGRSVLGFFVQKSEELPTEVRFEEDSSLADEDTQSMFHLDLEDSRYLQPNKLGSSSLPAGRVVRDLEILLQVSQLLGRFMTFDSLSQQLLNLIMGATEAERGAIMLDPHGPLQRREFSFNCARQLSGTQDPLAVSRTFVQQVLEKGEGIVCKAVTGDPQLEEAESIQSPRVQSLLCVPIRNARKVTGIIYLDSRRPGAFDEDDLQLLVGIAGIINVPLDNLQRLEVWERENSRDEREAIHYNMLGDTEPISRVRAAISKVAKTDATVLIRGETGTGKELVARAIHNTSRRSGKPFVELNCASLKRELIETELFGSEPGAFTGAVRRKGKLEIADGGTLFLDEAGEMDLGVQGSLLRVLETGEFQRVGGNATIRVDVRLIAATHVDLKSAIDRGLFREDLFHRLNVFSIDVPALRDRRDDIPELAAYFRQKASKRYGKAINGMTDAARGCFMNHDWPGNIRQLQNAIEHAVIKAESDLITVEDLPGDLTEGYAQAGSGMPKLYEAIDDATKRIILDAVRSADGRVAEAARLLGVHPNNLHRLIARHNLKDEVGSIRTRGA